MILPPLGALIFTVYLKTDWGISLFFLTPLALVAIPALRVQRRALFNIVAIWLAITLVVLVASRWIAEKEIAINPNGAATYGARSELARELTRIDPPVPRGRRVVADARPAWSVRASEVAAANTSGGSWTISHLWRNESMSLRAVADHDPSASRHT